MIAYFHCWGTPSVDSRRPKTALLLTEYASTLSLLCKAGRYNF